MVSKDLRAIKQRRKKYGSNKFNVSGEISRSQLEQDIYRREAELRRKKEMAATQVKSLLAIESCGLKVGQKVTDGIIVGKITSINPKTRSVSVYTGLRSVTVNPTVLKPI